jgi:hypothetical protein
MKLCEIAWIQVCHCQPNQNGSGNVGDKRTCGRPPERRAASFSISEPLLSNFFMGYTIYNVTMN